MKIGVNQRVEKCPASAVFKAKTTFLLSGGGVGYTFLISSGVVCSSRRNGRASLFRWPEGTASALKQCELRVDLFIRL